MVDLAFVQEAAGVRIRPRRPFAAREIYDAEGQRGPRAGSSRTAWPVL